MVRVHRRLGLPRPPSADLCQKRIGTVDDFTALALAPTIRPDRQWRL